MPKLKLILGPPLVEDDLGIARLSAQTMSALGINLGETIEIAIGSKKSSDFKVTSALPEDEQKNIVRISAKDFMMLGGKIDKQYTVTSQEPYIQHLQSA
ncbi:MAG: hypothetical protein ACE5KO_06670 [Candidatus Bathyarchaeia archaeon]